MTSKPAKKAKDEYIYSVYDQLEWGDDGEAVIYSDYQKMYGDTVYLNNFAQKRDMPTQGICKGIECISDFVDIELLKQALSRYGLKLPRYIIFTEPNILYKAMQASAWTPSLSKNKIYINRYYYETKDELGTVEAIAHETWHLTKQPKLIRKLLLFIYEDKASQVGESVCDLYRKMREVTNVLDVLRRWK